MIAGNISWKKADTKRIQNTMARHHYFGFADEPTANECLQELQEMFEVCDQEDDDHTQRYINKQFAEKLRVRTPSRVSFSTLYSNTLR
jgi:hypothetical protein